MALPESWHIRSRARVCTATGRPFEDGETIVTALFPDAESSGYVRLDFCLEAWKARTPEDEKPFSFWKAVYQAPVAGEKPDAFKKESPEDLLRRLVEEEEEHTENVRYILAVMLERKKVLRETDSQRTPSGIIRVYEHRKLGDVFIVRDPDLPLNQIDKVQDEVFMLVESGGRRAEEEVPAEVQLAESEASGGEAVLEEGDATPEVVEEAASEQASADEDVAGEEAAGETSPKESDSERV